ncbi:MAG: hypothetical protein ACRDSJ_01920 [Rubrobacteraceae bacterium]
MSTQMNEAGIFAMPAKPRTLRWRTRAVEEYERSVPARRAGLRTELAARLLALTGRWIPPDDVYADVEGRMAVANLDGDTFRLHRDGGLTLSRPCAYCGTGRFESPEINDPMDLGYALSIWKPMHEDCEDYDPSETPANW